MEEKGEEHNLPVSASTQLLTWDHRVGSISLVAMGVVLGLSQYVESSRNHLDFVLRTSFFAVLGYALYRQRWRYQEDYSRIKDSNILEFCRKTVIVHYQLTNLILGVTGSMIGAGITGILFY